MGKHFTNEERAEIERLKSEGMSHREIGARFGFSKTKIKEYFHNLNRRVRKTQDCEMVKKRGRPRKTPLTKQQEYELRIKELEREVNLLRSFLQAAGKG